MRLSKLAMVAAIACGIHAGTALGQQNNYNDVAQTSFHNKSACDCGEAVCGCEPVGCQTGGCESGICDGACGGGCDSGCGLGLGGHGAGDCCLGDPYKLFGDCGNYSAGGWIQMGYHNKNLPLFNNHADNYNLHQAWLYAEKAIDTRCGFDLGGRIDYIYGVDGPDLQATGNSPTGFDNNWDHGIYGHAIPQLYAEAGYGDLAVKVGRFFGLAGYESLAAPNNFFYSHTYARYYNDPFTHTGVLASYRVNDYVTSHAGYVLGWNSGFEDNGDAYLSGFSARLTDYSTLTYTSLIGRFNENLTNNVQAGVAERGYMNSIVLDNSLSDSLRYVLQVDYLDTENASGATARDSWDISQYLMYYISDCLALGARYEWYQQEGVFSPIGQEDEIHALTLGLNYRPHANFVVRPEIRWDEDHSTNRVVGLEDGRNQTTFGIDTILVF